MKKYTGPVSVEWTYDLRKQLRENFSNRQWADLTNRIVKTEILPSIARGISPVEGVKTFAKYKNPAKYPGDRKPSNKPNLNLTGDMLSFYEARPSQSPLTLKIGIHSDAPELVMTKAVANNEGTESAESKAARREIKAIKKSRPSKSNRAAKRELKAKFFGIVARPFIPRGSQSFTKKITLEIRKAHAYCLSEALNRIKSK